MSDLHAGFPAIARLIPHRASMSLLDRVVSAADDAFCAGVSITERSMFFDEQTKQVGAWLGIEYMAQAIAAFEGYRSLQRGEAVKIGFLLGARNYESHCAGFSAGMLLHVTVHQVLQHENGLGAFECRITDVTAPEHVLLANATVTVFKPEDANHFLKSSEGSVNG